MPPAGRSAHEIALDFVHHVRGPPATAAESDLLREALECCSEDPDLVAARDAVVSRLMRLHELSITAFGPFVDTVRVDFDELAAGGLFLLTGDTGSGKTSVLDAVCFALYGEVPGDRHTARHLRSDQAPEQSRAARGAAAQRRRRARSASPVRRLGAPQAARHGHHPRPGPRGGRGAAGRRVGRADQPARRGRPARHRAARHDVHPVHPGGDAPPGPVPGLPAGQLDRAPRRAAAPVPHPPLRGGRALAGRAARRAATSVPDPPRRVRRSRQPVPGGRGCRHYPTGGTCTTSRPWPTTARSTLVRGLPDPTHPPSSTSSATGLAAATAAVTADQRRHRPGPRPRRCPRPRRGGTAQARGLEDSADQAEAMAASVDAHRRAASVLPRPCGWRPPRPSTTRPRTDRLATSTASAPCSVSTPTRSTSRRWPLPPPGSPNERAVAESWLPRERELRDQRTRLDTPAVETWRD